MRVHTQRLPVRNASVEEDWCAWLPSPKAEIFDSYRRHFNTIYGMFSVSLNEALELRRNGNFSKSCQAVWVIPSICSRLAGCLSALLGSLAEHARHYGTIPNAAPLDPGNFQGIRGQRTARMNDLLSRVLLTQRSQFLYKIDTLSEMVGSLADDFRLAAEDLGCGASDRPSVDWQAVDHAHYDLNTCLRETIVLLKSFLVILPNDQVEAFQKVVHSRMISSQTSNLRTPLPKHGRMASIERE